MARIPGMIHFTENAHRIGLRQIYASRPRGSGFLAPDGMYSVIMLGGQSTAMGQTKGVLTGATGPSATHKMLASSVSNGDPHWNSYVGVAPVTPTQLNALQEKLINNNGQTLLTAALEGLATPWIGNTCGVGASGIAVLAAAPNRTSVLNNVAALPSLNGKLIAYVWYQGQQDNISSTPVDYATPLSTLMLDLRTESGNDNLKFGSIVTSMTSGSANAMSGTKGLMTAFRDGLMTAICPEYFLPFNNNDVHTHPEGQHWLGKYVQRWLNGLINNVPVAPMYVVSHSRTGNVVTLTCNREPTIDVTNYHEVTQKGFRVTDNSGGANIAVSSISTSGFTITLTLASTPSSGCSVRYAVDYVGVPGWNTTNLVAAGNVYAPSTDRCTILGISYPMHHWLLPDILAVA